MFFLKIGLVFGVACCGISTAVAAETDYVCSKMSCEYQFIEKLIRMEIKLETIENQMKRNELNNGISKKQTEEKIVSMHDEIQKLKQQESKISNANSVLPLVAFSVFNPTKLSLVEGELILFQKV